ncbi:MAG: autotransporter-associated beta strand repeat-containing protein [Chthoniobacter sp.]|nr:autotransporter-associated beta strand repeat-containing protein [Chthoniobacter sp.]
MNPFTWPFAALAFLLMPVGIVGAADPDTLGVLKQPIPDKLVVLTFDDAPASHATVVAPILKELGFGGTIYVCDFDGFKTRKDWYLTYRQMNAMHADGLEIGNHTVGHYGGYEPFLAMEDQVLANGGPRMTTLCWPVYAVNWKDCPKLSEHGYTFGRGGHERTYRPTLDNPFDVPSFSIHDGVPMETFIKQAQQACQGRVVVYCFHGVPDMEHPPVGLEPATFKVMMQYLKDNHYQCIAMRDLAKYIDPVKAAKLPATLHNLKENGPVPMARDDKPYSLPGTEIERFEFRGLPGVQRIGSRFRVTAPFATNVTALAPNITLPAGSTIAPESGVPMDFTQPQNYAVTAKDGSQMTYTVTVTKMPASTRAELSELELPGPIAGILSETKIGLYVAPTTDVRLLAPTFKLSEFAVASPPSGTVRDFSKPQTYTVTAQDGSTRVYTVTVIKSADPVALNWSGTEAGKWSDGSKWAHGGAPVSAGKPDYVLNFTTGGNHEVTNDLPDGLQVNQLNFEEKFGLNLTGNRVKMVPNPATGSLPEIRVNTRSEGNPIRFPIELAANTTVDMMLGGRLFVKSVISGPGSLTLNCPGSTNSYHGWGLLRLENKENTYSGGTIINGGQIFLLGAEKGFGTGPVTLNDNADIRLESHAITNPLIVNGGTIEGGTWDAPITLNGTASIAGPMNLNEHRGGISGRGGITKIGPIGPFSRVNQGELSLWGTNTYTGPTIVQKGTLTIKKAVSLYNAEPANWSAEKITVQPAATLCIPVGGPGEFTGAQLGTLLTKLTTAANQNGLMAGAIFCVDTVKATDTVTITSNITDGQGAGGGAFVFRKSSAGTLRLAGTNTYTGKTILEGGTLSVTSLNSVVNRKTSSSLGAPTNVEDGEIVIGKEKTDDGCALLYTGTGETTDRVINLAGKESTVTFNQSGTGLLKFTSDLLISGYGANKTIALTGDTAGTGEFAGRIADPHDRAGKATTTLTKSGKSTWTLSGINTYSGPTTLIEGILILASERSLGPNTEVNIGPGATLNLNFSGEMKIRKLTLDGKPQAAGLYRAKNAPGMLSGTGVLNVRQ